jgi:GxxExxY protein
VILELKSVEEVSKVSMNQVLTYLRLTDERLGLLINFSTALIKDGIYYNSKWIRRTMLFNLAA